MSVNTGWGGQRYIPASTERLANLRHPDYWVVPIIDHPDDPQTARIAHDVAERYPGRVFVCILGHSGVTTVTLVSGSGSESGSGSIGTARARRHRRRGGAPSAETTRTSLASPSLRTR